VDVRALRRALLRRLVALRSWATWSPRRARTIAGVCLAVLVVSPLAVGVARSVTGRAAGSGAGSTETSAASPQPQLPSPLPSTPRRHGQGAGIPVVTASPSGANDADVNASSADEAAAASAAKRFASLWLAGAFVPDRHRWVATMSDLVDPSLVPFLESTPASAIPRTSVTSTVPRLVAPSYGSVRVTFADGTGMDLDMSATGRSWRVVQYLPSTGP
jgi:hypothetical protein